jgi:hypothetical protein
MARVEKSVSDVFTEGIKARNRGEGIEDNPYPVADRNHEPWRGGWRTSDVLRGGPPTAAELVDRLARGVLH